MAGTQVPGMRSRTFLMPARLIKIILFSVLLSFSFTKNEVSAAASADKKTEKGDGKWKVINDLERLDHIFPN